MLEGLPLDIIAFCIGKYLQPLDVIHLGATQKRTRRALGKALEQVKTDWKSCEPENGLERAAKKGDLQLVLLFIENPKGPVPGGSRKRRPPQVPPALYKA